VETINAAAQTKITFSSGGDFRKVLNSRVDEYFREHNLKPTGNWRMYLKTALILLSMPVSYIWLVFYADTLLTALIAGFVLAQGFILVGLNIMHDGNHGSYSSNKKINSLMGFTLDLAGGSNLIWRQKHNILHHTYTNIHGVDEDLHTSGVLRLSPNQEKRSWHRFQHLYALLAYGFLTITWVLTNDLRRLVAGRILDYRLPRASRSDLTVLFFGKACYLGYMLVLPLFLHSFLHVAIAFVGMHIVQGVTLSLVFQLAHAMGENSFPKPADEKRTIDNEWAAHEVETTANFAPKNKLATLYLGGLNFQIEHHLFPKVCHVHYPALGKIVEKTCADFSLPYISYPTVRAALVAHFRFLRAMG